MELSDHHCGSPRFEAGNPLAERGVRRALWLTSIMMIVEIAGGWWFNSMAVLADGWHMSSHTLALGLSAFTYWFARHQARHRRYAFGTWKVEVLGGYTSALLLLAVAALMVFQSVERLLVAQTIQYRRGHRHRGRRSRREPVVCLVAEAVRITTHDTIACRYHATAMNTRTRT